MRRVPAVLVLATAIAGCQPRSPEPDASAGAQATASGDVITGAVQEQLSAPPYAYLRLKTATGEVWAAVPEATVAAGTTVTVYNPMLMSHFESKSLQRTFDEVWFGTLSPAGAPAGAMSASASHTTAPVIRGAVARAAGADARTVAEVWAQKEALVGKSVTIHGVVAKYTAGVMGKNWIHLQDGSGDPAAGSNDLTVTSLDAAAPGDTITVTGTVRTNQDLGAGYNYPVLVEDARVVRH